MLHCTLPFSIFLNFYFSQMTRDDDDYYDNDDDYHFHHLNLIKHLSRQILTVSLSKHGKKY